MPDQPPPFAVLGGRVRIDACCLWMFCLFAGLRLEIGPRDMAANKVVVVRRDTGEKIDVPEATLVAVIQELLLKVQADMYAKACKHASDHLVECYEWVSFQ